VGFNGSINAFAKAYLADRQGLERRYQELSDDDRVRLARHYGATYVIAAASGLNGRSDGPLHVEHVEGRYAVYRVESPEILESRLSGAR
jgi:hypothetical protein